MRSTALSELLAYMPLEISPHSLNFVCRPSLASRGYSVLQMVKLILGSRLPYFLGFGE